MSKGRDRTVYQGKDKKWINKRNDADRAGSKHDTQKEAIDAAREMLINTGGGELTTKGRDGRIRRKILLLQEMIQIHRKIKSINNWKRKSRTSTL